MKIRVANKIMAAVGSPRERSYTEPQICRALSRYERTKSAKKTNLFWKGLMRFLGPEGRAQILSGCGHTKEALAILMRSPEEEWAGDPTAMVKR